MLNIGVTTVNKSTVWDRIKYVFHMCFLLFMTARGGAVYGSIKLKINPLQAICSKQIRQTMWMAKTEPVSFFFFFFLRTEEDLNPSSPFIPDGPESKHHKYMKISHYHV